jgi:hypothetical protein
MSEFHFSILPSKKWYLTGSSVKWSRIHSCSQLITNTPSHTQISDLLEVASAYLPLADGGQWDEERMNTYLGDPIHAGYHLKREGEKYVMTRLNFPDPPISLEDWLECNPLVRMRPIRLE